MPKLLLLRFEAILILAAMALAWVWNRDAIRNWRPRRADLAIAGAAIVWAAITTAVSPAPAISAQSLITVVAAFAVYFGAMLVARRLSLGWLYVFFIPALINGLVLVLQMNEIWIVMPPDRVAQLTDLDRLRLADAALLGNRDDVGTALLVPTILSWTLVLQHNVRRRWLHALVALALTASLLATRTFTSLAALGAGVAMLAVVRSWKRAIPALAALAIIAGGFIYLYQPMRYRVSTAIDHLRAGEYNQVLSGRLVAFRAAAKMFADHPIAGVGPGRYGREFFNYGLIPHQPGPAINFNEAHNDQLQLLAETGLPGFAIFIAALAVLALNARGPRRDEQESFARDASLPLAASIFVSTFAQFPLQLAVTIVTYATAAGVLRGWTSDQ